MTFRGLCHIYTSRQLWESHLARSSWLLRFRSWPGSTSTTTTARRFSVTSSMWTQKHLNSLGHTPPPCSMSTGLVKLNCFCCYWTVSLCLCIYNNVKLIVKPKHNCIYVYYTTCTTLFVCTGQKKVSLVYFWQIQLALCYQQLSGVLILFLLIGWKVFVW